MLVVSVCDSCYDVFWWFDLDCVGWYGVCDVRFGFGFCELCCICVLCFVAGCVACLRLVYLGCLDGWLRVTDLDLCFIVHLRNFCCFGLGCGLV